MMPRLREVFFPPPNYGNTDNPLGSAFALTVLAVFVQGLSRFGYSVRWATCWARTCSARSTS